jgi:hypothetical protein
LERFLVSDFVDENETAAEVGHFDAHQKHGGAIHQQHEGPNQQAKGPTWYPELLLTEKRGGKTF